MRPSQITLPAVNPKETEIEMQDIIARLNQELETQKAKAVALRVEADHEDAKAKAIASAIATLSGHAPTKRTRKANPESDAHTWTEQDKALLRLYWTQPNGVSLAAAQIGVTYQKAYAHGRVHMKLPTLGSKYRHMTASAENGALAQA